VLVTFPGQPGDSPANVLAADANHLEDRRPEFAHQQEYGADRDRCDCKSDDRRQEFVAEAPLNPAADAQHGEDEENGHGNIHRKIETAGRNTGAGAGDVTHVDRMRACNSLDQSRFARRLFIGHMKAVSIDELLRQLRINDEMTTVGAVGKIEMPGRFRWPGAVPIHARPQDARARREPD